MTAILDQAYEAIIEKIEDMTEMANRAILHPERQPDEIREIRANLLLLKQTLVASVVLKPEAPVDPIDPQAA